MEEKTQTPVVIGEVVDAQGAENNNNEKVTFIAKGAKRSDNDRNYIVVYDGEHFARMRINTFINRIAETGAIIASALLDATLTKGIDAMFRLCVGMKVCAHYETNVTENGEYKMLITDSFVINNVDSFDAKAEKLYMILK